MTATAEMSEAERAAKRQKFFFGASSPLTPQTAQLSPLPSLSPEATIDVNTEGDTLLIVTNLARSQQTLGIRVSSQILSSHSPAFKTLLHATSTPATPLSPLPPPPLLFPPALPAHRVDLRNEDADALLLVCNALHLRNAALPYRLDTNLFLRFVRLAAKYDCGIAVSRAATAWFDHICQSLQRDADAGLVMQMVEASRVLDDPVYFARFSTMWVVSVPVGSANGEGMEKLGRELRKRQGEGMQMLKMELDLLVNVVAEGLCSDAHHFVECAPGDLPDAALEGEKAEECTYDRETATTILAALRDAKIWPAMNWGDDISAIVKAIAEFRMPIYDSSEGCDFCARVEDGFVRMLGMLRSMQKERLWGLCLDCFKAGGTCEGECRVEHVKTRGGKDVKTKVSMSISGRVSSSGEN